MQPRRSNQIIAAIALATLMILALFLGLLTGNFHSDPLRRPSTFFTDEGGARAMLLVLQRVMPGTRQWRQPLTALALTQSGKQTYATATLIVAGPSRPLAPAEANALQAWVKSGGQLILLTEDGWKIEDTRGTGASGATVRRRLRGGEETQPGQSDFLSRFNFHLRHAPTNDATLVNLRLRVGRTPRTAATMWIKPDEAEKVLSVFTSRHLHWEGDYTPLAYAGEHELAVEIRHGQGRVLVIGDPGFFSNRALRQGDNAVCLVNLCSAWGPGPVLIDEYHHGFGQARSTADLAVLFLGAPWGWSALQLVLAGGLYVFGFRRRMGRLSKSLPAPGPQAVELIEARGGLLGAARARRLATDLILQHLSARLGVANAQPVDLLQFCQEQVKRHRGTPLQGRFTELEDRYRENIDGQFRSDQALTRLAQLVGRIHQQLSHEH